MNFQYETLGDEYQFQTFLKDLFNAVYSTETFQEYGSKGNLQHGIDVYSPVFKTAIQAKKKGINRNKKTIVKELINDLSQTLELIKGFPFPIEILYFATTIKKDVSLQEACFSASISSGINVILFSWDDIQEKLPDCLSVRDKYFPHLKPAKKKDDLSRISKELESLISKLDGKKSAVKTIYRNIPHCEILLPSLDSNYNLQKQLLATIMKISLFETYCETKYKKFGCLIHFTMDYTQFTDDSSAPGFQIISGEVVFLANFSRLAKGLQNNSDYFWDVMEKYQSNVLFKKIRFRMELLASEGLIAYEFEVDGQTESYNIKQKKYYDLDYGNLGSLNAVMPFIAKNTQPGLCILNIDKIQKNVAFMKLYHHFLNEDSFSPSLLKINVDDFDDWDYEYTPCDD